MHDDLILVLPGSGFLFSWTGFGVTYGVQAVCLSAKPPYELNHFFNQGIRRRGRVEPKFGQGGVYLYTLR